MLSEEKCKCLVDEWIEVISASTSSKYYQNLGYKKYRNKDGKVIFKVKPWELKERSHIKVKIKCPKCGEIRETQYMNFFNAKTTLCRSCANNQKFSKDLTGQRFGRLAVIKDTGKRSRDGYIIWQCNCDCGNTTRVYSCSLLSGNTRSCGCLQKEKATKHMTNIQREQGKFIKADHTGKELEEHLKSIKTRRQDFKWEKLSKKIRKNGKCTICKSTENLVVHHKNGYWEYPEQRYDEDNLVVLCNNCHSKYHASTTEITKENWETYYNGQL